jgi:tRNA/rRNA methyltransferase
MKNSVVPMVDESALSEIAAIDAALASINVVLVRPSHPGNVGAAARAMKTMGLARLSLVAPRAPEVLTHPEAHALASGASDILAAAQVFPNLDEALASCQMAIAMTARDREFAPPWLSLEQASTTVVDFVRSQVDCAFVFGTERSGLDNEEVMRCRAACSIDANPEYSSLNLAQAVQIVAHQCRRSAQSGPTVTAIPSLLAVHEDIEGMVGHVERALVHIGYLGPNEPKRLMERLRRMVARVAFAPEEVHIVRGICKAILETKP